MATGQKESLQKPLFLFIFPFTRRFLPQQRCMRFGKRNPATARSPDHLWRLCWAIASWAKHTQNVAVLFLVFDLAALVVYFCPGCGCPLRFVLLFLLVVFHVMSCSFSVFIFWVILLVLVFASVFLFRLSLCCCCHKAVPIADVRFLKERHEAISTCIMQGLAFAGKDHYKISILEMALAQKIWCLQSRRFWKYFSFHQTEVFLGPLF